MKRINTKQMHFVNFDICLDGTWEEKSCDKGSLFWVIPNCCIPIEKYPTFDECVFPEEEKNLNETEKPVELSQTTLKPKVFTRNDEMTHEPPTR